MIGFTLDPDGSDPDPYHTWSPLYLSIALAAVITATGFLGYGVVGSVESWRWHEGCCGATKGVRRGAG